jgi:hypothetical protein
MIRNGADSTQDDKITIKRVDGNVLVDYYDARSNSSSTTKLLLTRTALSTYMKHLCILFANDSEPYEEMQINYPGFPCFMATQKTIHTFETRDALLGCANIVSDSWFSDFPEGSNCDCGDYECEC